MSRHLGSKIRLLAESYFIQLLCLFVATIGIEAT